MLETTGSYSVQSALSARIRNAVHLTFDLCIRQLFRFEVRGLENFTRTASTLVVANHRRDSDGPVIASVLLQRKLLHFQGVGPSFVAREDMFKRGFLTKYLDNWPTWARALLSPLDLGSLLMLMGIFPIRRVPERSLGEVLQEVRTIVGDLPLQQVLKPQCLGQFARAAHTGSNRLRISDVMKWRYHDLLFRSHGLTKLTYRCFRQVVSCERSVVDAQLEHFSHLLDDGATLVLAPEGRVSPDGRIGGFRAGLQELLNRPHIPPRVLPVGVTYDAMTNSRPRVFVGIGPELCGLRELGRREINARVAAAIRHQLTVTCSQLASRYLLLMRINGHNRITRADADDYVAREAARYVRQDCHADPGLLAADTRRVRLEHYLASCVKHGILQRSGKRSYRLKDAARKSGPGLYESGSIIGELNNELSATGYPLSSRVSPVDL